MITLALMVFLLPAGIADGVMSGGALVLILIAQTGAEKLAAARSDAGINAV